MRGTGIVKGLLLVVGLALILTACGPGEEEARVLLIFSYHAEYAWHAEEARGANEILQREGIACEAFYLDTKRHADSEWKEQIAADARDRIDEYEPTLVIVFDDNACDLVAKHYAGESLPFVFCGVNVDPAEYGFPAANFAGVLERPDFAGSAELLRLLVPDAERVALILDDSPSSAGFAAALDFTNDFDDWQAKVLAIQSEVDAIGLFTYHTIRRQGEEESMSPDDVLQWTLENSRLPEIAPLDFTVEGGALCGVALSAYEQGTTAAEIAIRILAGERPSGIPLAIPQATRAMLNAARAAELGIEILEETLSTIELIQ